MSAWIRFFSILNVKRCFLACDSVDRKNCLFKAFLHFQQSVISYVRFAVFHAFSNSSSSSRFFFRRLEINSSLFHFFRSRPYFLSKQYQIDVVFLSFCKIIVNYLAKRKNSYQISKSFDFVFIYFACENLESNIFQIYLHFLIASNIYIAARQGHDCDFTVLVLES